MGFGSPPPGEHMKTVRAILFFVAMLALWTAVQFLIVVLGGGSSAVVILLGVLFGYPAVVTFALLESLSSKLATGYRARALFLLFVAGAYITYWYFLTSPEPSRGISNRGLVLVTIPGCLVVIAGYLMRGHQRERAAEQGQAA
jgi:hypothetical protein